MITYTNQINEYTFQILQLQASFEELMDHECMAVSREIGILKENRNKLKALRKKKDNK